MVEFALPKIQGITGARPWPKPAGRDRDARIQKSIAESGRWQNRSTDTYSSTPMIAAVVLTALSDQENIDPHELTLPRLLPRGRLRLLRHEHHGQIRWPAPKSMHDVKDGAGQGQSAAAYSQS